MKKIIPVLIFMYSSISLSASSQLSGLSVSPIFGIERVQKIQPTPHTKERMTYGIRVLYGPSLFSFEAEATKADDSEVYDDTEYKEESIAAKVGLRSSFNLVILNWFFRAGGHARQKKITKIVTDLTFNQTITKSEPAIKVSPYAGTGFKINLPGGLFMTGGVTAIFTGEPKGSDKEFLADLAWGIKF